MKSCIQLVLIVLGAALLSACNILVKSNYGGEVYTDASGTECAATMPASYPDFLNSQCSSYDYEESVTLTPQAQPGYHFVEWRGACQGAGSCQVNSTFNRTVTAVFAPDYQSFAVNSAFADERGILYLMDANDNKLYRWQGIGQYYLEPINLGSGAKFAAISQVNHRLYVAYDDGNIKQLDYTVSNAELMSFASLNTAPYALSIAGALIFAVDNANTQYLFDVVGELKDTSNNFYLSSEYAWDATTSRFYHFRDHTSPNDILYQTVDLETLTLGPWADSPYHGSYSIEYPIRVSADGQYVLTGSGDIYHAQDLKIANSVPIQISDAYWSEQALLTLRGVDTTILEQWDEKLKRTNLVEYPGCPVSILPADHDYVVVTRLNDNLQYYSYSYNLDADGDGIPTTEDKFPLDPAASLDSDNDGYPDEWNDGKTQDDSTTGLILDAFPQDSSCQLPEHGNKGVCDIGARLPDYQPEQVLQGNDNLLYLFDRETQRIYRWNLADKQHLNPILLSGGVKQVAFDLVENLIFTGSDSGEITRINADTLTSDSIAATPGSVNGLAMVGNYLLAQDPSGAWATHYIFSKQGDLMDFRDWNCYSRVYTWDPVTSRVYFFRDDTSPNDLHYEVIDQSSGIIGAEGETPYHGDYSIIPPIRVSVDGQYVLLGSGDIYKSNDLTWKRSLGVKPIDALWTSDGGVIALTSNDGGTVLRQYSADFKLFNQQSYAGTPVAIVSSGASYVVVTEQGKPQFFDYVPTDDADADGVTNTEDAFPTDPAASVDSDNDGYPDEWNPGYSEADSTTGLTLDVFPEDMACQTQDHAIDGLCDFAVVVPTTTTTEDICTTDNVSEMATSGRINLSYPVNDIVPLCSGWVIVADAQGDNVRIVHVSDSRTAAIYPLTSAPSTLLLDAENKILYVALATSGQIAKIGLLDNSVHYFSTTPAYKVTDLVLGPDNSLLAMTSGRLFAFGKEDNVQLGSWTISGTKIVYNSSLGDIISINSGSSLVYRYSFGISTGLTQLQFSASLGDNMQDIDLSPDNQHLTIAAGGGNGSGYTIYDIDPGELTVNYGFWDNGAYPQSTAFSITSDILISKNYDSMLVFSVSDYALLNSVAISSNCKQVEVSRGNQIAFALSCDSYYSPKTSTIQWLIYQ